MKKFNMFALLFIFSTCSFSMNIKNSEQVYRNIVNSNGYATHPSLYYNTSKEVNATYEWNNIDLNDGMIKYVKNKDEMAWVLSHEFSHSRLHTGGTWQTEMDADRWGMYYMKKAGYNPCVGIKLLQRANWKADVEHPPSVYRYNALKGGCK